MPVRKASIAVYLSNVERRRRRAVSAAGMTYEEAFAAASAGNLALLQNWFERNTGPRLDVSSVVTGTVVLTTQAEADAIAGKTIRGKLQVDANDLEVQDFVVEWDKSGTGTLLFEVLNGRTGLDVHHFRIDGHNGNVTYGIGGTSYSTGCTFTNGEIRQIGGDAIRTFKSSTYRHLYCHSFRPWLESRDGVFDPNGSQSLFPHTDAVQTLRSGNVVEECWLENTRATNSTAACTIKPDADEAITSFEMRDSYLDGGGVVFYIDNQNADADNPGANGQPSGLVFENLLIGRNWRDSVWRHSEVPSANITKTNIRYVDTKAPVEDMFVDNFNRANENLEASANWQRVSGVAGALAISSNRLASTSTTQSTYLVASALPIDLVNHFAEVDWRGGSTTGWLLARYADENNYIGMQILSLVPTLYQRVGSTFSILGAGVAYSAGDRIRIECRRQQIRLLQNSVVRATVKLPEGLLASGRVGIQGRTTISAAMADNFAAGSLSV